MTDREPPAAVVIDPRFRGPPRSGNGGYTCGLLAAPLAGTVAARLRAPPPLGVPLVLERAAVGVRLLEDGRLVGDARTATLELAVPEAPDLATAALASRGYAGFRHHPFPGCFVCGPERAPGDGLRIFPGLVAGTDRVAAPWTPDASLAGDDGLVDPRFLWSALDCTGAFAVWPDPERVAVVLGELCARIDGSVAPGEPCVVTGWPIGQQGRRRYAGSALFTAAGRLVGCARATWFEVPPEAWR